MSEGRNRGKRSQPGRRLPPMAESAAFFAFRQVRVTGLCIGVNVKLDLDSVHFVQGIDRIYEQGKITELPTKEVRPCSSCPLPLYPHASLSQLSSARVWNSHRCQSWIRICRCRKTNTRFQRGRPLRRSDLECLCSNDIREREQVAKRFRPFPQRRVNIPERYKHHWNTLLGESSLGAGETWPEEIAQLSRISKWPDHAFGTANAACLVIWHRPGGTERGNLEPAILGSKHGVLEYGMFQ